MTTAPLPPFSARNRHKKEWIEEDFPVSARIGLLHLLNNAIDGNENAVKEAVCAVEAAAKELFPDLKATTLGDFIKSATGSDLLPKTIGQTFSGLYAFRNSGEGVSHGAASGGPVTPELSEYVLGIAASQIVLLADLAKGDEEPPF